MAAVAWYYCAGNSVYYWTKAYDMSATQFAIAVSERIGRTITASDVAQAIRQKEVDAMPGLICLISPESLSCVYCQFISLDSLFLQAFL